MATNSKVFVSPGVYTSEVDLSFVAQSVGVTTLGIVGETLKGPAFEPIFIRSFDEFSTYFGGTSPEKFINTQIPKYEASYIAKAYLQQSNQLFVTRILGLSGYDAGPSWSIKTVANVDKTTVDFYCTGYVTIDCSQECNQFLEYTFNIPFSGCDNSIDSIVFGNITGDNSILSDKFTTSYTNFDGTTSSLSNDVKQQIYNIILSSTTLSTSATSLYSYGAILGSDYSNLLLSGYTGVTNVFNINNVDSTLCDYTSPDTDVWYYSLFDNIGNFNYSGSSFYSVIDDLVQTSTSSNCASFYNFSVSGYGSSINYATQTINVYLPQGTDLTNIIADFSACTSNVVIDCVAQESGVTENDFSDTGCLIYQVTSEDSTQSYNWLVCMIEVDPCNPATTGQTGSQTIYRVESMSPS